MTKGHGSDGKSPKDALALLTPKEICHSTGPELSITLENGPETHSVNEEVSSVDGVNLLNINGLSARTTKHVCLLIEGERIAVVYHFHSMDMTVGVNPRNAV